MGNTPPSGELRTTGTLEIKDSRTDKNYSVPILQGGVPRLWVMRRFAQIKPAGWAVLSINAGISYVKVQLVLGKVFQELFVVPIIA